MGLILPHLNERRYIKSFARTRISFITCVKITTDSLESIYMWKKTKVMRISRQPLPIKIIIDQKQLENMESFKYFGSNLTNDGRCTCEIKCRIAMA